jgi:iron-sulfur cluster repair protein YtfE (RIC family)
MEAPDPLVALEHDHVHLSRLVSDLRGAFDRGDADPEDIAGTLASLRDDLFDHFAREEEALFPYLMEVLPDLRSSIARLEDAHDRICGAVSRLHSVAVKGSTAFREQHALAEQLFRRFDSDYVEHARHESELLRSLATRLSPEQRVRVRSIMAGI